MGTVPNGSVGNVDSSNIQAEGYSIAISGLSVGGSVGVGKIHIGGNVDGNIVIGNNNQVTESRRNRKKK